MALSCELWRRPGVACIAQLAIQHVGKPPPGFLAAMRGTGIARFGTERAGHGLEGERESLRMADRQWGRVFTDNTLSYRSANVAEMLRGCTERAYKRLASSTCWRSPTGKSRTPLMTVRSASASSYG